MGFCSAVSQQVPSPKSLSKPKPPRASPHLVARAQSAHQVDEILVANLSILTAVSQCQEHLPLVRVHVRAVALQEAPELACADVACVPRVKLQEKQDRGDQWASPLPQYRCGPQTSAMLAGSQRPRWCPHILKAFCRITLSQLVGENGLTSAYSQLQRANGRKVNGWG